MILFFSYFYVGDMLIVGHDKYKDLSKSFVMKDLGATKKILAMKITCDENEKKKKKKLWLS